MAHHRPLILFDGVCNLCNSTVQWVIERDKEGRFDFASLQSQAARRELESVMSPEEIAALPDSIVLVDSDGVHTRSAAALRIVRALGSPFALLGLGVWYPVRSGTRSTTGSRAIAIAGLVGETPV